jgi:hypothetical protein
MKLFLLLNDGVGAAASCNLRVLWLNSLLPRSPSRAWCSAQPAGPIFLGTSRFYSSASNHPHSVELSKTVPISESVATDLPSRIAWPYFCSKL